jgi:hypothetical protein
VYKGHKIETYTDTKLGNAYTYRYIIFHEGEYIDGGGPYPGKQEKRDEARRAAEKRIDRILETGYN